MGKRLIQQARGKGGPAYRSRGFAFGGDTRLLPQTPILVTGTVISLVKSAGHTAPLMHVRYENGNIVLLPAPEFVKVGDTLQAGPGSEIAAGNTLRLADIPEGTPIYNIESHPGDGGKFCKSSGSAARLVSKTDTRVTVLLPSKKEKQFNNNCRACVGIIAGGGRTDKPLLKAGKQHYKKRMKNKRWPNPSGAAQNAVDHPFGNTRSSRKAKQRAASRDAPPGKKVGSLWPKKVGKKK